MVFRVQHRNSKVWFGHGGIGTRDGSDPVVAGRNGDAGFASTVVRVVTGKADSRFPMILGKGAGRLLVAAKRAEPSDQSYFQSRARSVYYPSAFVRQ